METQHSALTSGRGVSELWGGSDMPEEAEEAEEEEEEETGNEEA